MKTYLPWVVVSLAAIISVSLLGRAYNLKQKKAEIISVTGSADTNFTADLIVWNGDYSRSSFNLQDAFNALKADEIMVKKYLSQQGLSDKEITTSSISTEKLFDTRFDENGNKVGNEFKGYKLTQKITIESSDLKKVDRISREITELIQQGVELNSESPDYYYSKLGDLKIGLLAKASADGRKRAETIAQNAGNDINRLNKATMGVFQITGQNMNEDYSFGGVFNTSSINKTASITVKMEYEID
ncbi:MAG: SIMPL domain-containing protein [Chitinophagaceae bacterium]